jgi:hypothetical protein
MIQAYPDSLSVIAGGTIALHIGTDHPEFRVVLFRQGALLEQMQDFGWQSTSHVGFSPGAADVDWRWDGYDFDIPTDWLSGAYVAMLWERDGSAENGPDGGTMTTAGNFGKALFVVRTPAPGRRTTMLYRVPIATYHAYNVSGGASLYHSSPGRVTMHRPGGGAGGAVTDFETPGMGDQDALDAASSRQTFEHYDARFIRWLEASGLQPDYCADIDCHGEDGLAQMTPYGVVISVGHDEYWSTEMRANLAAYVAQGGNLALFSGNTCWWRIHYDADLAGFACNRSGDVNDPSSDQWWIAARYDDTLQNENALIGASYRNGGGWWWAGRPLVGYTVQNPQHWVYEGGAPAEFGTAQSLVGYECDGAELTAASANPGATAQATYADGTPPNLTLLGVGLLPGAWSFNVKEPDSATAAAAPFAATMGIYSASGTVFNAGVIDWPRVLEAGEPTVERITRTAITRLGGISFGKASLAGPLRVHALDAFYTPDDHFRHVITGQEDGTLTEVFFNPNEGTGEAHIGTLGGIVDVAGFYSADDHFRHAIVAQQDGSITEVFFHPTLGHGQTQIGQFPGVVAIAAFYSGDDHYRHVIVAQQDGSLSELFYHPQFGIGAALLGRFEGISDVGAFYSQDDHYRHAIVLANGDVSEVFFNPKQGSGVAPLAHIPDARRISGFYVADDPFFSRRVCAAAADGRLHEVRFGLRAGIVRSVIANFSVMIDVGAFFSPDDGFRHAVVSEAAETTELFYRP